MIWFRALPLLWQIGIEFALVVGLCVAFAVWKHGIYMQGWDAAMLQVKSETAARLKTAQENIIKIGEKHAKSRTAARLSSGYNRPASPLVGIAIDSMSGARSITPKRPSGAMHRAGNTP